VVLLATMIVFGAIEDLRQLIHGDWAGAAGALRG
jgi:hypothetical protein